MFEEELDDHLGYDKYAKSNQSNARNGYGSKTIKSDFGETRIDVPHDRESCFEPVIVPKRKSMVKGVESLDTVSWILPSMIISHDLLGSQTIQRNNYLYLNERHNHKIPLMTLSPFLRDESLRF